MSASAQATMRLRLPARLGRWALALCVIAFCLAAGYTWWLRDSSLVAVESVDVEGVPAGSADAAALRQALVEAGQSMTTLHLRPEALEEAVKPFPLVRSVSAEPGFPNRLTVRVTERRPAALIGTGSDALAVAADGTILRGVPTAELQLPRLPLREAPRRLRLTGTALEQALVLGAAPKALQPFLDSSIEAEDGVIVELASGIELRFGRPTQVREKWRAAAAVLADPELTVLDYVDLSAPRRPAVGGAGSVLPPAP